jgi:hypothetical protein
VDVVKFNQRVKHGVLDFHPTIAYGFKDPDAAPYFKACGWAEDTEDEPVVVLTIDELDVDPCTIWGDGEHKGKFVMPDRAAAARGTTLEEAQAYVWDGQEVLNNG